MKSSAQKFADQKCFAVFIPSRRRIALFQKNIRQLNVEFMEKTVGHDILNNKNCLSDNGASELKRKQE